MHLQRNLRKYNKGDPPRRCHRCNGTGLAPCRVCGGNGRLMMRTNRNGTPSFGRCEGCYGRKLVRCSTCCGQLFV
jgi:CCR4-NOT transcription complex subunit 6